ncbi:hypothetical protein ACQKWADRAFT_287288 [Trichoderma austrokoningii]
MADPCILIGAFLRITLHLLALSQSLTSVCSLFRCCSRRRHGVKALQKKRKLEISGDMGKCCTFDYMCDYSREVISYTRHQSSDLTRVNDNSASER